MYSKICLPSAPISTDMLLIGWNRGTGGSCRCRAPPACGRLRLGTQDFKHLGTERILTPFHEVGPFGERLGLAVAVELHHRGTGDVTAGRADLDGVFAALHVPVIEPLRPVGKGAIVELEGDFCGFASLEEYLLEALKLVFRAGYVGLAGATYTCTVSAASTFEVFLTTALTDAVQAPVLTAFTSLTSNVA